MLARFRSAVSKSRLRQRELDRRQARRRTLRAEPLEGRLLLAGDSWVVPVDVPTGRRHVATDNDGNVYVATTEWLGKFDPAGQQLWTKAYQGAAAYDLAAVAQDGVYMVGSCGVAVDFDLDDPNLGQITLHSTASDGFLAKFNTDGQFMWALPFGGELNDRLIGVTTADNAVFVTGAFVVPVRKGSRTDMLVAKVTSNGDITWTETFPLGQGESIQVFAPSGAPASVYVAGGPVTKLIETVDEATGIATGATVAWSQAVGVYPTDIAVGTHVDENGTIIPSVYATTGSISSLSAQLVKFNDQGQIQWSRPIMTGNTGTYWKEMAFENDTIYVAGEFAGEVVFGDDAAYTTLTSRGETDAYVARYAADGGSLQGAQRMGGSGQDGWYDMAVAGGYISTAGWSNSANGDYSADNPASAGVSAFVPGGILQNQLFVMRLDAAAPIVHATLTDITVPVNAEVTLSAMPIPGSTITWYDSCAPDTPLGTGASLTLAAGTLLPGVHQISAIATDDVTGKIGMAGVVVTVAPPATLTINDVAKAEGKKGTTNFTFTVTRGGDTSGNVTVSYATANGTATAGSDYTAKTGSLAFAVGETTKTITVGVIGDRTAEPNETFFVNLSNVVGGQIVDSQAVGTILNDDGPALMADFGEHAGGQAITLDQAQRFLDVAATWWSTSAHFAVPAQLAVELDDLPSGQLGAAFGHTITLDMDANGAGWYTDRAAPAAGRVDLLTVLAHEVGHLLGYDHSALADDLMAATLPTATRRLPGLGPIASSPLALPETRLNVIDAELVDQTLLMNGEDRSSGADNALWLLPMLPTDDMDVPQFSSDGAQARLLQAVADEETDLLDEALLALIAAEHE